MADTLNRCPHCDATELESHAHDCPQRAQRPTPITHELEPKERVTDPLVELLAITLYMQTPGVTHRRQPEENSRITPDNIPWVRIGRTRRNYFRRMARGDGPLIDGIGQHMDGHYQ